jgi:four helix bundle protein
MGNFRKLIAYQKAFKLAMDIFKLSKSFPSEERFEMTSQIRNSSRSVCASISEAYRKRQYPAHFSSKLSDADMENSETQVWLDFALECNYLEKSVFENLLKESEEIGKLLNYMIDNPDKFK